MSIMVSLVKCATDTATTDVKVDNVLNAIRTGGSRLKGQITEIRNRFAAELAKSGDRKKAKIAVKTLKEALPAVMWSGSFTKRANNALSQHSGLLHADLDSLGERLLETRKKLVKSPHLFALWCSPTDGVKAIFRVPADPSSHLASFRAVEKHVKELTGVQIDQSCKDVARLCFMSYDPHLYVNASAVEITLLPEPEKPKSVNNGTVNLSERQSIATGLLGEIDWQSETSGYFPCPGKHLHTTGDGERDCRIDFDNVPTVHCFHDHCRGILDGINHELRSRIGKAEYIKSDAPKVAAQLESDPEPAEPQSPPAAPYVPPPLVLLPSVLQSYVRAAAESLNVDVAFILLPLLSSLGAAIGNSRSILLKRGFVQPPVIWTGIIGRSGSRKSPALEAACFAVMEYERELMRQNKQEVERYMDELAAWNGKKRIGPKPEPPAMLTCLMDDLTLAALADAMQMNTRGVLVRKDELSHWFSSFDQFTKAKGADVSRWLSLHTGVFFGLDRRGETRAEKRSYRIYQPRVGIAGGIQHKVLARALTEDFFERGLPARFLFAYPPARQDQWSEATVPEKLESAVLDLFKELWLLQPEKDENDHPRPKLLRLSANAKVLFTAFYNECGAASIEAGEHEEAAWCKLTGYAARLALVGQLARDPNAEIVTGETMQAACDLARWFGHEAVRIYASLAETPEQRLRRELIEFIERRGGAVYEREVMQSFTPLKNGKTGTQRELNAFVAAGRGKWEPIGTTDKGGRPTRKFRLLPTSTSTKPHALRGKTGGCVDVDAPKYQKNEASGESDIEAVSNGLDPMPGGDPGTMTAEPPIKVFEEATERGLKLGIKPPATLTVQPANRCPLGFAETLSQHKWHLSVLLQLPFVMAYSKTLQETIFLCEDDDTKAALIDAGADEWSIYTKDELRILVAQNRIAPLGTSELRKLHKIKRTLQGRITI